jgi:hypothetical protein
MNDKMNGIMQQDGKSAMEYAQQMAWLISLKRNEYITEDEYEEACKKLNMKYHQTPRL